jgi:hypothetical protein
MLRCRVFVYNSSCGYLLDDSWILAIVNFITAAAAAGGADMVALPPITHAYRRRRTYFSEVQHMYVLTLP